MAEFAVNNVLWNISNRLRQVWRCEAEHLMDVTPIAESNDRASYSSDESVDQEPLSKLKTGVSSSSRLFAKSRRNGCSWLSCQTVLALIAFFGFCNVYALRVNLSVALVAMVNDTTKNGTWKFYWREDSTIKGVILSSFFIGYIATQLIGGWLSQSFGGKRVYGYGILLTAILSLLSPLAVNYSVWLLVVLRIAEGMCEGVTFPAMHSLLGQWATPMDRSKLAGISYSGAFFGTVISILLSGLLCDKLGWPSVFYFFGMVSVGWWFLWTYLVYDTPDAHPRISVKERKYIEQCLATTKVRCSCSDLKTQKKYLVPP
jgi:MFS family permease